MDSLPQNFFRNRIAGSVGAADRFACDRVDVSACEFEHHGLASGSFREARARFFTDRRAGRQRFNATALAAAAERAMVIDDQVPGFGGCARASVIDAAVKENSRADACADAGVKHIAITAAGSPERLGKACGLGVVLQFHGAAVAASNFGGQRIASPASYVGRIQHHARVWIERARSANSDAARATVCFTCEFE